MRNSGHSSARCNWRFQETQHPPHLCLCVGSNLDYRDGQTRYWEFVFVKMQRVYRYQNGNHSVGPKHLKIEDEQCASKISCPTGIPIGM